MSKPETTTLRGELPGVKLVGSTGATAEVYTHGAHLSSWKTADGVEQIFISSDVSSAPPSSIIPIVTPKFAPRRCPHP